MRGCWARDRIMQETRVFGFFVLTLGLLCGAFAPETAAAPEDSVVEEVLDRPGVVVGWIDWTKGTVAATGRGATQAAAEAAARKTLESVLLVVSVDEAGTVGDRVLANRGYAAPVLALAARARVQETKPEGGEWRALVETSLLGKDGLMTILWSPPPPIITAASPARPDPAASTPQSDNPAAVSPNKPTAPISNQPNEQKKPEPATDQAAPPKSVAAPTKAEQPAAVAAPVVPVPTPTPSVAPVSAPPNPPTFPPLAGPTSGPFTGLLIDGRGLGIQRCISPRVVTQSGKIVYGCWEKLSDEEVARVRSAGIVGYLLSEDVVLKSRAGSRPLVIRAVGKEGASSGYVIVTDADGARILQEETKSHFFKQWAVAFLIRP